MMICLFLLYTSNSWIGVTVLFPVPTSPTITKWLEKSMESRIEKIGSFGLAFLGVPCACGSPSLSKGTGSRDGETFGSSLAKKSSDAPSPSPKWREINQPTHNIDMGREFWTPLVARVLERPCPLS